MDIESKRPDRAYVEHLISSDLLAYLIPKHRDYTLVNTDRGGWQRKYKTLCRVSHDMAEHGLQSFEREELHLKSTRNAKELKTLTRRFQDNNDQHEIFKDIYNMIVDDNLKSGIQPLTAAPRGHLSQVVSNRSRHTETSNPRPQSMMVTPTYVSRGADDLFITTVSNTTSHRDDRRLSNQEHISPQPSLTIRKERPIVRPKPECLQSRGRIINGTSHLLSGDLLAERFSQLRVQPKALQVRTESEPRNSPSGGFVEMPSPTDYSLSSSDFSPSSTQQGRPNSAYMSPAGKSPGRHTLPPTPQNPPHPPKIPLEVGLETSLPRAPSPAYNPSRNYQTSSSTPPPLPRASSNLRSSHTVAGISTDTEGSNNFYKSSKPNNPGNGVSLTKAISTDLPQTMTITADELYDHLRAYNVLVIDVRCREEFDQGHIFAKSVMCIEPLSLGSGISAEELEDRLVVSPGSEQALFEQRNEFDLVVYYDQKTRSTAFLTGAPTGNDTFALRALHDTIYEFNYYKPLRRPPVMLVGGIEAWEDLVGRNGLATSSTAALVGSTRPRTLARKPGRPLGRVPMASSNSYLEVRKKRLREYKPLNADEERTWLETARNEQVQTGDYQHAQSDGDTDSNHSYTDEPISPYIQSYEEFLRRFPEPAAVGKQSMMVARPPPPPARPAPSMPAVPSRPPPAVPRPSYGGVSERESSGMSPTSRQPTSAQPPLYTSKSISHYLKLPRTGLINFSVTCYLNATIQCLLATIPLSQFFLDNRWRDFTQKNWKGSNGIMPDLYANLIRNLWRGEVQAIRPSSFRQFCARLNREWGVDRQQDAKEFLDFLLDCLHEDLNINWERSPLRPLSTVEEERRENTPMQIVSKIEWERYSHRESSFISSLFAGQHASRLRCTTCQRTSTTYEAFYSISVEIPRSGRGDIYECLRSYCQEEMLSKDEMWKCSYCKCERQATKQITITRAPQVLVVHFKRFSASKTESARKVHTPINFPLHGLNIEPYMVPPSPDPEFRDNDAATTPPFLYDAYAVMRHLGSSGNGGHYISLVRDAARNCWRKFDDEKATDFDPRSLKPEHRLQNEQAYLVFYGRSAAR